MSSRKEIYRANLFEHTRLNSLQVVEEALYEFESVVHKNNCQSVIGGLLSEEQQYVLPLVLSSMCSFTPLVP